MRPSDNESPEIHSPDSPAPVEAELVEAPIIEVAATRPALESPRSEPYGVPRRFGIGTILVITTAFGLLLSLLQAMGTPPGVVAFVVVFVSLIGAAQMLLYRGRSPRRASVAAGVVVLPLMTVCAMALSGSHGPPAARTCSLASAVLLGGGFGYLAGGAVAGVFLMMDAVEQSIRICRGQPLHDEPRDES